jgi:hypothetical protein
MCLMITADHGPAVSGAHNTIVCARAGKDLVSSLVSGLLTIVRHSMRQSNENWVILYHTMLKQLFLKTHRVTVPASPNIFIFLKFIHLFQFLYVV